MPGATEMMRRVEEIIGDAADALGLTPDELKARARLSQYAPELLAALRAVTAHCDSMRDFVCEGGSIRMVGARQAVNEADDAINNAYAVIAKAEGKQ